MFIILGMVTMSYSQDNEYVSKIYKFKIKNGADVEKEIQFEIHNKTFFDIKKTKSFEEYVNNLSEILKDNLSEEKKVENFLRLQISLNTISLKYMLQNKNSFDFIDNSIGTIILSEHKLLMKFKFKGQNGYGNYIIKEALCSHNLLLNDENKREVYIL